MATDLSNPNMQAGPAAGYNSKQLDLLFSGSLFPTAEHDEVLLFGDVPPPAVYFPTAALSFSTCTPQHVHRYIN